MASHTAAVSMLRTPGGLLGDKAASNTAGKRSRPASHQPRRLYFSRAQRLQQPVVVNREYGSHRAEGKGQDSRRISVQARADLRSAARQTYGALQDLGNSNNHETQKKKRTDILKTFFSDFDKSVYDEILAEDCAIKKEVDPCDRGFVRSKAEWMNFLFDVIQPAIPDFTWGALVGSEPEWGDVDRDGWCVCSIQVCGHHTGAALEVGQLPPLSASGSHFCFPQQQIKLKIDTAKSQVTEIEMVPKPGTNVVAMYRALGGSIPKDVIDTERSLDDNNLCVKGAEGLGPL